MHKSILIAAAIYLIAPALSAAGLEGRVTRIENILKNQRGSDLLLEIQRLQTEIQLLRGQVEQQQFDLEALKRQQKDQYLDLDGRLRNQVGGGAPSAQAPSAGRASEPGGTATPADATARAKPPTKQPAAAKASDLARPGAQSPQPMSERDAYRNAFDQLKQRRYEQAAASFNDLLARYPNGEFADNARYWLGEAYYVKRDYPAALAEFQRVVDNYPLSPKVAGATLKIGYIQDEQKDQASARATLEGLVEKFPDSTEARLAKGRLEQMARN